MVLSFFSGIENSLVSTFGSLAIVALAIIFLFFIAFLLIGLDIQLCVLFSFILIIPFSRSGWIPSWIEIAFWILVIGFGIYKAWGYIDTR